MKQLSGPTNYWDYQETARGGNSSFSVIKKKSIYFPLKKIEIEPATSRKLATCHWRASEKHVTSMGGQLSP